MHSDDTLLRLPAFKTPSCHLCLQRGNARPLNDPNGLAYRTPVLPFPKDLGIADYRPERTGSSPRQVHAEETHRPFYSWGEVRPARWDAPQAPCTCVREVHRDCGCIQRWYYPEHPFNSSQVPPHLKVRGQWYYREVLCASEQHYKGPKQEASDLHEESRSHSCNGHCQRRRVSFQNHEEHHGFSGPETGRLSGLKKSRCNGMDSGQAAFFPTEVPPGKLSRSRACGPVARRDEPERDIRTSQGSQSPESHGNRRKSQGTVREQIKQVVNELEEVLGGLKQVQLEMKEVVQQIDILTSNIDLNEEDPNFLQDGRHRSSQTYAVPSSDPESSPKSSSESSDSSMTHGSVSVDSFPMNNALVMRNHKSSPPPDLRSVPTSESPRTGRTVNGTCLPHWNPKTKANGQLENHKRTTRTDAMKLI